MECVEISGERSGTGVCISPKVYALLGQFYISAFVRFEVLTAVTIRATLFEDVTSCSLVHFTFISQEFQFPGLLNKTWERLF